MSVNRRALLAGAGAAMLAGPAIALAQSPAPPPPAPPPSRRDRIAAIAGAHRHRLDHETGRFSGPGWDWLLARGRDSHFFLIGEQHGIAENAKLAGALFTALAPAGYAKVAVETSPPMAEEMDRALGTGGMPGLRRLLGDPRASVAFFGMREEAEWLAAARAALPGRQPFLWGMDYEIAADRHLIGILKAKAKPPAATEALARLEAVSNAAWARYGETHDISGLFSFTGDPALVAAVRAAWPRRDAQTNAILETLEETCEINRLWAQRRGWDSNERRARFMRASFLARWRAERRAGRLPRVMMKMGANHLVRGQTGTGVFDLGTLVPEIAVLEGVKAFQLLVVNGPGTETAQLDPASFRYRAGRESELHEELAPVFGQALPGGFTLFETAPLRAIARPGVDGVHPELVRMVNGYDAILLMTGSTASANL